MNLAGRWLCNDKKEDTVTCLRENFRELGKVKFGEEIGMEVNKSRLNIYKMLGICKITGISLCISITADLRAQLFLQIFMDDTAVMVLRNSK